MDEPIQVKAKRLVRAASLPARSYDDDSGFDLRAIEAAVIAPRRAVRIRTGLALAVAAWDGGSDTTTERVGNKSHGHGPKQPGDDR